MRLWVLFACWVITSLIVPTAEAHDKSISYSDWSISDDDTISVRIRVPARITTLLLKNRLNAEAYDVAAAYLQNQLSLRQGDAVCEAVGKPRRLSGAPDTLVLELRYRCPSPSPQDLILRNNAFFPLAAGHVHFIRSVHVSDGSLHEAVLTAGAREAFVFPSTDEERRLDNDWALFGVGVYHILGGADHLVFVLGLLLIAKPGRDLFLAITGFTLGHSLSLAAAVTGFVSADSGPVEALIALTIWLLGALALRKHFASENRILMITSAGLLLSAFLASFVATGSVNIAFWVGISVLTLAYLSVSPQAHTGAQPISLLLTASLGLTHGFGFAGGLQEAFASTSSLAMSLIAFNLGVEAGQLIFIGFLLACAFIIRRLPLTEQLQVPTLRMAGVLVAAAGALWFTERAILAPVL